MLQGLVLFFRYGLNEFPQILMRKRAGEVSFALERLVKYKVFVPLVPFISEWIMINIYVSSRLIFQFERDIDSRPVIFHNPIFNGHIKFGNFGNP